MFTASTAMDSGKVLFFVCKILIIFIQYGLTIFENYLFRFLTVKVKQTWRGPEISRKLRFPDFVSTLQDKGRLSALGTTDLNPRKCSWYSFLLEADSTPGP